MSPRPPARPPGMSDEPELNNERDIPTEGGGTVPDAGDPADADAESVAGEEDPGAALDTEDDT